MPALANPWFLLLLPAGALLLSLGLRRSLAELTPAQRRVCLAVRAALLLSVVLALAGVRWRERGGDATDVLFLIDASASMAADTRTAAREFLTRGRAARHAHDAAGVLGFARSPRVWQPTAESSALAASWPEFEPGQRAVTDVGRALDFAAATLSGERGAARRVVLLSDGNDTAGGAAEAAARLVAATGAELWTVPLRNPARPEALVAGLDVPRGIQPGEPFDVRVDIRSNTETRTRVDLYQDRFLAGRQEAVALRPGRNEVVFRGVRATGGFTNYEVEIFPEADTLVENNRAQTVVALAGPPRVLLIDADESKVAPLAGALRAEKIEVETRGIAGLPRSLDDLQRFDLFLLSDVPALSLSREQMELYRTWVSDFGGGFALLGGENSFGVGGYFRTPIETLLPVRLEHDDRQETPNVALLVVLDRSGSMTARVGDRTKMSLADDGATLAFNVLGPRDYFGLTAVDTIVHNVVPLDRVSGMSKATVAGRIAAIDAGGGGIYIYTSLVDAFRVLRGVDAKVKHCLLFSDAADAEEKAAGEMGDGGPAGPVAGPGNQTARDLVAAMLANRITTSVVGLGGERDKDVAFLKGLAETGNGRFYLTDDARNLPQIFSTETMKVSQSSLVEEPFQARPFAPSPITAGIDWGAAPLLLGVNATKPKPTAEVALTTETGEPLLATWRYGLGQAAAFTSDAKARWAAEWLTWPGYGKFWVQLTRGLLRTSSTAAGFQVHATEIGDGPDARLRLDIDALTPAGGFRDGLTLNVAAVDPQAPAGGDAAQTRVAEPVGPGAYRVELPLSALSGELENDTAGSAAAASLLVSVSSPELPGRPYVFGHTRSYPREYLTTETNEVLLRELAEIGRGRYDPAPADVFTPFPPGAGATFNGRQHDLTNFFLGLALSLLPLDIYLRRRVWRTPGATTRGSQKMTRGKVAAGAR